MSADATAVPVAEVPARDHVPRPFLFAYGAATLGMWMAMLTPVILTLADRVEQIDPAHKEARLSLVLGTGAFFGLLCNPVFGRLSDRTCSRWGMRRPWLVGSALAGVAGLTVTGLVHTIAGLVVGWCLVQAAYNAMLAAMMALLPDHVAPHRRGMVSGVLGACQALAAVIGTGLANLTVPASALSFIAPGLVALAGAFWLVAVLPDRRLDRTERTPFRLGELARSFWVNPRRYPDFGWAWASRFMIFMSVACVLNYQVYYLRDRVGLSHDEVNRLIGFGVLVTTVVIMVGSNVFGRLSDRLRRRRGFVVVAALVASCGLLTLAVGRSVPFFLVAMALVGMGQGVYFAVDLALMTEVLPDSRHRAAEDLGVLNVASVLPQSLGPAVAPLFLGLGAGHNYPALFLAGTAFAVVSALTIAAIRGVR